MSLSDMVITVNEVKYAECLYCCHVLQLIPNVMVGNQILVQIFQSEPEDGARLKARG